MKKYIVIVLSIFMFGNLCSQTRGISYQALIINPQDEEAPGFNGKQTPLANKEVCLRFSFLDSSDKVEYQEIQKIKTDEFGMVNLMIGMGKYSAGYIDSFKNINWDGSTKRLKVEVDVKYDCQIFEEISNQILAYVPFAFYALNSPASKIPGPKGDTGLGIKEVKRIQDTLFVKLTNDSIINLGNIKGNKGDQGIQGPIGNTGNNGTDGVSITNANVESDSLKITLSNGIVINSGYVKGNKGDMGIQGKTGSNGISIMKTEVKKDSLWIMLSDSSLQNAGYVKGNKGDTGVSGTNGISVTNSQVVNDSLKVTLSNGTIINAGYVKGNTGAQGPQGLLTGGANPGNTPYWNGAQWVINNSNIFNNGGGVGIGTTTPNASAKLEISSTSQGFLPPRLTTSQRNAINNPIQGLIIYNTTVKCIQWFNGNVWNDACGNNLSNMYPPSSVFCESGPTNIVDVVSNVTGKIWMDRNLGAKQAAISITDTNAYGDLYQWGRRADGHQCRNSSSINTLSSSDQPTSNFIISTSSPYDWRSPQNSALWQGTNGVNNPCPNGYRVPTETELEAERQGWISNDINGAYSSQLKLPASGHRNNLNGLISNVGIDGNVWSSTTINNESRFIGYTNSIAIIHPGYRSVARSVRCIKDSSSGFSSISNTGIYVLNAQVINDSLKVTLSNGTIINAGYVKGNTGGQGPQGPQGPTGATGAQGPAGTNGISVTNSQVVNDSLKITLSNGTVINAGYVKGNTGAQGPQGIQGLTGATGPQGATGLQGPAGTNGVSVTNSQVVNDSLKVTLSNGTIINAGYVKGNTGAQGPQGIQGLTGATGPQGPTGATGSQGPAGTNGISVTNSQVLNDSLKVTLSNGTIINAGYVKGNTGALGPQGIQGPAGTNGISVTNSQVVNDSLKVTLSNGTIINAGYVKGNTGAQGPQGIQGLTGATGPQGPTGATGSQGSAGTDGISVTNSQVVNDSLKVTLSNGTIINAGYVKGNTGALGPQGIQGPAGTNGISVTNSQVVNDSLKVTLSNGTIINAGYVKGNTGPQGLQGIQGLTGPQGPTGATGAIGPAGANGISVTNTQVVNDSLKVTLSNGTIINAGYVKGNTGALGPQGIQGPAGTNGISVTNSQVVNDSLKVTLSNGTIINAGYVKGNTGAQGPQGIQGPAGTNGISVTNSQVINDSLKVTLSNGTIINAGYVKGNTGAQGPAGTSGISVTNSQVVNDSLKVTLSNGTIINAGYVKGPKGDSGISITNTQIVNDSLIVAFSNGILNNAGKISSSSSSSSGNGGQRMSIFTTSTTFTVPSGVTSVIVELWGAGGGCPSSGCICGTRGSWGKQSVNVTPNTNYTVQVGIGGSNSSPGGCGGTSSFAGIFARGGRGGLNSSCLTGSNATFNCLDCLMPPGSTLGYGAAGPCAQAGAGGLVIIYY